MTDRRKAILVEAARDLAEMQEGSDAGWGLWYDWLDTVVRRVEREEGMEGQVCHVALINYARDWVTISLPENSLKALDRVRVVKEAK